MFLNKIFILKKFLLLNSCRLCALFAKNRFYIYLKFSTFECAADSNYLVKMESAVS